MRDEKSLSLLDAIAGDMRGLIHDAARSATEARATGERSHSETKRLLLSTVDVLDAFDRVFQSISAKPDAVTPQMNIWLGNFRAIRRMVERHLHAEGVVRLETIGAEFDPQWHSAAETADTEGRPDGAILEERKAGYVWRGEVLRKSEVVVVRHQ